jgi:hypothetical protein
VCRDPPDGNVLKGVTCEWVGKNQCFYEASDYECVERGIVQNCCYYDSADCSEGSLWVDPLIFGLDACGGKRGVIIFAIFISVVITPFLMMMIFV